MTYAHRGSTALALGAALLGLAAGPPGVAAQAKPATAPKVTIVSPKDGEVLTGPRVHVVLAVEGVEIAPAAMHRPGTAHHHLFLDVDMTAPTARIPAGGIGVGIVRLGGGETEFTFDSVPPGVHRLIDVLGHANHIPLNPLVVDSVHFTVK